MRKRTLLETSRGLTLVELLVAMTIFSMVIAITLSIFLNVQKTHKVIEKKYDCNSEADRIVSKMEYSLRLARQLIAAGYDRVKFLDVNTDTIEYYQKGDTLFWNGQPATDLAVDSLIFTYVKFEDNEKITDFHVLDIDNDGVLDVYELNAVSGVMVNLWLSSVSGQSSIKVKMEKQFFTRLRNLSY